MNRSKKLLFSFLIAALGAALVLLSIFAIDTEPFNVMYCAGLVLCVMGAWMMGRQSQDGY